MVGWKRGGFGHLVIGFAILIALVAVVQVSLPVMVAGTASELAPDLMSVPSVEITVPERPSWEQSVSSCSDGNLRSLLGTGGDGPICLVDRGNGPFVSHNYS